jgi:hypothetical protein
MQSRRSEGHRFQWQHSALWPPSSFIVMTVNSISSRSSLCIMFSSSCAVSCGCTLRQCSLGRHMLSTMFYMRQHTLRSSGLSHYSTCVPLARLNVAHRERWRCSAQPNHPSRRQYQRFCRRKLPTCVPRGGISARAAVIQPLAERRGWFKKTQK